MEAVPVGGEVGALLVRRLSLPSPHVQVILDTNFFYMMSWLYALWKC
jgi:hypothetical protein